MKTIKSLTEAEIAELPKLPDEWKWERLGGLVNEIVVGYVGPITQFLTDDTKNGVRFLSTTHIGDNRFLNYKESRYVTNEFSMNNKKSEVVAGDIIVARHGDSGKCCIIPSYIKKAQVSNAVIIRPNNELFVNLYIIYSFGYLKQSLQTKKVGGVQQVVNTKTMEAFPFPLPPLPEQRAIVSKIEQLFSELDNGISNLKLAQEQLKVYRQAVLKKAFEGELTKKWREQQKDLPDAGDLLEQVKNERGGALKVFGKKVKPVSPFTEAELAELYSLPKEWRWIKIGDFEKHIGSGATPKGGKNVYQNEGIVFIRSQNVYPEGLFLADVAYISQEIDQKLSRSRINEKDVLLNITGASIGRCTYVPVGFPKGNVNQHVCIIRPNHNIVYYKYLSAFLNSPFAQSRIGIENTGVTRQALTFEQIRKFPFPLCSFSEQQAIVQEIETRLSVCDKIEQDIGTNLEKAEALRQSILKKAFEGKLLNERELAEVRGAEDWEPAEVLLEKVRKKKQ